MNWEVVRKNYPIFEKYTYLDTASAGPISIRTAEEAKGYYDELSSKGDIPWDTWLTKVEDVRRKIARFLNASPEEICFTQSTSHGMNLICDMINGDIITMDEEFPTSTFPFINKGHNICFIKPKNHTYSADDIQKHITRNVVALVTSDVQASTGFKQDLPKLGKLCKKNNLIFVVDPTQSLGASSIDVRKTNIDFLAFNSYKWLNASYGIGCLYINSKRLKNFKPPLAGWFSVKNPDLKDNKNLDLKKTASALDLGSPQFPNIFALGNALDEINAIGIKNIEKRVFELGDYLKKKVKSIGLDVILASKKHQSGIQIVKVKSPKQVAMRLSEKKIIVSATKLGIRVSLHFFNNKSDIDILIQELDNIVRREIYKNQAFH